MTPMIRGLLLCLAFASAGPLTGCEVTLRAVDEQGAEHRDRRGDEVRGVRVFRPRNK